MSGMLRDALLQLSSRLAAGVDQAFYSAALARSQRSRSASRAEGLGPDERIEALARIREVYGRDEHLHRPETFFPAPQPGEARVERVRSQGLGVEVIDLRWRSRYEPFGADVAPRYAAHEENGVAVARLVRRKLERRPAVVLIHGYLGGELAIEERFWPIDWFVGQGFDVALFVMPFHGERRRSKLARPIFPSSDPRFTIEGFRHAVLDLRWLVGWLLDQGAPSVGVSGMSLGGYTTALLATLEPRLAFAAPMIPLASIADFARDGGRLVGDDQQRARQHQALEETFRVVSPLARPAAIAPERVLVLAGEADRITPLAHAERLASHLWAPLERFAGGHLLQLGRGQAFEALGRLMERSTRG